MKPIKLIVGLGNPGGEYEDTRHNAGFWFVDRLARRAGATLRAEKNWNAFVGKGQLGNSPVWLMQPQTFMNRSGVSVSGIASFYKITPEEILVAHDELDFLPGVVKFKKGGSSGGHNGLKDIDARIGGRDYWRLRIGIGHPRSLALNQQVVDFVLHRPSRTHQDEIDRAIDDAIDVMDDFVRGDGDKAVAKLHAR
ncbi:aminoacyl-tRNA hydrolase [Derxia gummosa]|uniref:Peptidyl-tRNA hydrolase n=1 Tax=Derxia gummosa DSM 723 TaxID=1121388 RepID=A0A8B6X6F5_9BURK|nr:aminoacyl-tRNA hydrolase [Derxia gummosa]